MTEAIEKKSTKSTKSTKAKENAMKKASLATVPAEITTTKKQLGKIVGNVLPMIPNKPLIPIYEDILFEVSDDGKMTATAGATEITSRDSGECICDTTTRFLLPGKKFSKIVNALPDDEDIHISVVTKSTETAQLTTEGENEVISNVQVKLACGKIKYALNAVDGDTDGTGPNLPPIDGKKPSMECDVEEFLHNIQKVAFCASKDESRRILNGVYVTHETDGKIDYPNVVAATDGRRLALAECTFTGDKMDFIVTSDFCKKLASAFASEKGTLIITDNGSSVRMETDGGHVVEFSKIDGTFPQFRQIVPKNDGTKVTIQNEALQKTVKRTTVIVNDPTDGVTLTFGDKTLTTATQNAEGQARDVLEIAYEGKEEKVTFNPVYLLEAVGALDGESVDITLRGATAPVTFVEPGFLHLIMPMRG